MACKCGCCSGACCLPDGSCQATNCFQCQTLGGQFQGMGSSCSGTSCPCDPPADWATCHRCEAGVSVSYCAAYCCAGVCQDTPCVSCTQASDCPAGQCCIDSICVPCQPCVVDADCPAGQCCVDGACVECPPCCVIDGVRDYTKTEGTCVSYCTLNGTTVSSTGQADCEAKTSGHCVQDGFTTGDTEQGCTGGYCTPGGPFPLAYGADPTTEAACETTYRGCYTQNTDEDILGIPEEDCVSGTDLGYNCNFRLTAVPEGGCPDGWAAYGSECYRAFCVTDCDACATDVPDAEVDCGFNDLCESGATRTKVYGVWHAKTWIIDHYGVWHGATWYASCPDGASPYAAMAVGPGTELKKLLAAFGIHASATCKCNKMAKRMNAWGPEESLNHIEEIVDVMEEEAKKRKLPFLRAAGRILVRKAIRNSRGNGS